MATAPLTYVAGTDRETLKANQAYQDALTRLTESLEGRKNRMFDPQLLALAEGLLTPGRTGSFFEGLGTAAGKMRQAEELEEKRAQEIAQAQLGLAERGLALQRARSSEAFARQLMVPGVEQGGGATGVVTDPTGLVGYKFAAPNTQAIDQIKAAGIAAGKDPSSILKEINEFIKDNVRVTEAGRWDFVRGTFTPTPSEKTATVNAFGKSFDVPANIAVAFNQLVPSNPQQATNMLKAYLDSVGAADKAAQAASVREAEAKAVLPLEGERVEVDAFVDGKFGTYRLPKSAAVEYNQLVGRHGIQSPQAMLFMQKFIGGAAPPPFVSPPTTGPSTAVQPTAAPSTAAPSAPPPGVVPAAPSGAPSSATVPSKSQREIAEAVEKQYQTTRAELAAKAENDIPKALETASEMAALSSRVLQNVDKSGRFVGLLSRPGIAPAALKLISEGIQSPGGTYKIPGVESAILRTAGATAEDIANIEKLRGDFSQANLLFAQMFMRGQGAITEGERRIVENVGGSVELSPAAIRARIGLMKERAEFDKKVFNDFMDWKKANPQQTLRDYQSTAQYRNALKNYEDRTSSLAEETLPNVRSRPSSLPTKGQTFIYQGKIYEYIGPDNDMNAAKNRNNYREVK